MTAKPWLFCVYKGEEEIMSVSNSKPLRVLVADDHAMVLEMFEQFLSNLPDIQPQTAPDLDAALELIDAEGPFDLVLVDLNMPGMNGVSGLGKALERNAGHPVGILTSNPSQHVVYETLSLGGAGIVLKTESLKNLTNVIRFMLNGGRYVPVELIAPQPTKAPEKSNSNLSEREMTVLALLSEGQANRDIGEALGLAEATVKMHVKSICTKLGAKNRTQAVILARDISLV
jgi:DNA-binding NarL/FixJ family response regulator